jgi:hypothetical protein
MGWEPTGTAARVIAATATAPAADITAVMSQPLTVTLVVVVVAVALLLLVMPLLLLILCCRGCSRAGQGALRSAQPSVEKRFDRRTFEPELRSDL